MKLEAATRWAMLNYSLLSTGAIAILYWLLTLRAPPVPRLEGSIRWPLILTFAFVALQLVPLPVNILARLSPAHGELLTALAQVAPGVQYAPLSVVPSSTLAHLIRLFSYGILFLVARDLTMRLERTPWMLAWPIIVLAAAEALVGLSFMSSGPMPHRAKGTFYNSNHFSAFLGLALPFAATYAIAAWSRNRRPPLASPLLALASAGLMAAGIVSSLSRMGFLASLASLAIIGIRLLKRANWTLALFLAALLLAVLLFTPIQLVDRFGQISQPAQSQDSRLLYWRSTLDLIAAYPVFGCGLGAYQSAFMKYKPTALLELTHAHNDYLQAIAELGAIGFVLVAWFFAAITLRAIRAARLDDGSQAQWLGLACLAAIVSILVHSLADFNLYIHANAMLFAWILGVTAGLPSRPVELA